MDLEIRTKQFIQYLEDCKCKNEYVGLGNPFGKILIVGKEPSAKGCAEKHIVENINYVSSCFENDNMQELYRQPRPKSAGHAWNKYQKLIDYVRGYPCTNPKETDFCMDVFTTEMNNTISPTTVAAEHKFRIDTFKNSDFIRGFPVIILACSDYIHNIPGDWQINDTFGVEFDTHNGAHTNYPKGNWFYVHHSINDNKQRLLIHTRNLSRYCTNALLQNIAVEIKEHLSMIGESL